MGYAEDLLDTISKAQKMGGKDRLAIGTHRLALVDFGPVKNRQAKDGPNRLVATFEVVSSTVYQAGAKATVAFFVERPEYPEYEHDNAKTMIDAFAACLGDKRGTGPMGSDLMSHKGRGIVIDCVVQGEVDENGNAKRGKKGAQFSNSNWVAIPQTWENVAEAREELDKRHPRIGAQAAAQAAPQTQAAPAAQQGAAWAGTPAPAGGSLLGGRK